MLNMYDSILKQNTYSIGKVINLKKSRGCLINIEFITDFICLKEIKLFEECLGGSTLQRISRILHYDGKHEDIAHLSESYNFLKMTELAVQNIFNTNNYLLPSEEKKLSLLSGYLGLSSTAEFRRKLNNFIEINNNIFDKFLHR